MNSTIYNTSIIVLAFIVMLGIAGLEISFKPFSIKINDWLFFAGALLLTSGMMLMSIHSKTEGYKKGYTNCINDYKEIIGAENTKFILEELIKKDEEKLKKQ